jgi:H2-forming N5,N10-methylenetetrahydromethanopterin dehydrogenase-like enzyme
MICLFSKIDAQITLYGSLLLECCLKEVNMIDIDIQFNETLPYETLKELLEIVRRSGMKRFLSILNNESSLLLAYCEAAHIDTEHEPLCIDLTIVNSNIAVRITSNYIRAIQSAEIIQIYTKFDKRLLSLLRLFRSFSKVSLFPIE